MEKKYFGKKGIGHLEMIISFVFFVGFVFFLFLTLKPYNTSTLSGAVVSQLYNSFEEKVHTNLTSVFLKANYTGESSCFYIRLPGRIFRYALSKSLLKDVSGIPVDSGLDNSNLDINSREVFYKVEISPEFNDNNLSGCELLKNYRLGSLLERKVVSYNSLKDMADKYNNNYTGLKSDLKIPEVFDFAIVSEELPKVNMERLVPGAGNVVAQDYILEVLKSDGNVSNVRFTLKVW